MDGWRENSPGSDPRYVKREAGLWGRRKLWLTAGLLLVGVIVTAVILFRPREPQWPADMAALEPRSRPEEPLTEAQPGYLPEKSPDALNLAPDEGPNAKTGSGEPGGQAKAGSAKPAAPPKAVVPPPPPASRRNGSNQPASPETVAARPTGAPALDSPSRPAAPPLAPAAAQPGRPPDSASGAGGLAATSEAAKPDLTAASPLRPVPEAGGAPDAWWVVNSYSTPDAADAERIFNKLRNTGHTVYSYQTEVEGKTWHRVRVGFFKSQAEARQTGEDLAKQHNLPSPWAVRPGPDELKTYKK